MNYTDLAKEVLIKLDAIEKRLMRIDKRVEEIYLDEDLPETKTSNVEQIEEPWEEVDAETAQTIKNLGQHIAYNLINNPKEVMAFREFIYEAKKNHRLLTPNELEYIDYADKNFEDIRLSRKHLQILQVAYQKIYNKPWPFNVVRGYLYKLEGYPLIWQWFT